jgi:hypothetical protein
MGSCAENLQKLPFLRPSMVIQANNTLMQEQFAQAGEKVTQTLGASLLKQGAGRTPATWCPAAALTIAKPPE